MNRIKTKEYDTYKVVCSDIEWDVTPANNRDEYDPQVVSALPKVAETYIKAPDEATAWEWGMNDVSENHGFCIMGCKIKVDQV